MGRHESPGRFAMFNAEKLRGYLIRLDEEFNRFSAFNFLKKQSIILYYSFRAFRTNQVPIRAAALTYTTFLAAVPFFILLFATAGAIGYMDLLSQVLPAISKTFGLSLPLDQVQKVFDITRNIKLSHLGWIGSITLFFSFLLAMSNLEKAMNIVWGIRRHRSWLRRLVVYTPFLLFLIAFISLLAWVLVELKIYFDQLILNTMGHHLNPTLQFGGIILSLGILIWLFVLVLYYLIPYTQVRLKSAVLGATISILLQCGLLYLIVRLQSMLFVKYSLLYGSLAVFPLLMIFFYINWVMLLTGVAFTYAHQKSDGGQVRVTGQNPIRTNHR